MWECSSLRRTRVNIHLHNGQLPADFKNSLCQMLNPESLLSFLGCLLASSSEPLRLLDITIHNRKDECGDNEYKIILYDNTLLFGIRECP